MNSKLLLEVDELTTLHFSFDRSKCKQTNKNLIFDSAKIFEENFQKWIGAFRESSSIIIVILPGRSPN
jgi:hypothetical protein